MNNIKKCLIPLLLLSILFLGFKNSSNERVMGRCIGNENCKACSSCSSCKHCSSGGSCGVCVSKRKSKSLLLPASSPKRNSQCQAITKKGAQCSRSASNSNYCWQHNR